MLQVSQQHLSPAQRAWQTRRDREAARAHIEAVKVGVVEPSVAYDPKRPIVDLWVDDAKVGCGFRRFVVISCTEKFVRLFSPSALATVAVDRITFDKYARRARKTNRATVAAIIRANLATADKVNQQAKAAVVSDGGADAAKALEVLR